MALGRVLRANFDDVEVLKFEGSIGYTEEWTFPLSKSLAAYIDTLFAWEKPGRSIVIDLTEATGIDSTNLGLLAQIATRSVDVFGTRATIIAKEGRVLDLLDTMSFASLCTVLNIDAPIRGGLNPLPDVPDEQVDVAHLILEAHRTLAGMSAENQARFHIVIEAIERDIKRKAREQESVEAEKANES